jgi:hypothetical protein
LEAKELEVAAEAERLRNKEPLEVMTKMLTTVQASLVEKLELMEHQTAEHISYKTEFAKLTALVATLASRIETVERMNNGQVILSGLPYPVNVTAKSIGFGGDTYNGTPTASCSECDYSFNGYRLTSLSGFQNFKQCETLSMCISDAIKDFSPLTGMTALKTLTISGIPYSNGAAGYHTYSSLTDIRWISSLVNLRQVSFIACNLLKDITPLATLRNLQEVTLRGTGVHSTECIARLKVNTS